MLLQARPHDPEGQLRPPGTQPLPTTDAGACGPSHYLLVFRQLPCVTPGSCPSAPPPPGVVRGAWGSSAESQNHLLGFPPITTMPTPHISTVVRAPCNTQLTRAGPSFCSTSLLPGSSLDYDVTALGVGRVRQCPTLILVLLPQGQPKNTYIPTGTPLSFAHWRVI